MVLLSKIQVFGDIIMCYWMRNFLTFWTTVVPSSSSVKQCKMMKTLKFSGMPGTTCTSTKCHIPEVYTSSKIILFWKQSKDKQSIFSHTKTHHNVLTTYIRTFNRLKVLQSTQLLFYIKIIFAFVTATCFNRRGQHQVRKNINIVFIIKKSYIGCTTVNESQQNGMSPVKIL